MADTLISHIGVAVADLDRAVEQYTLITGAPPVLTTDVPDQKVTVAMFAAGGSHAGGRIELVAPTSPDSPIAKFIAGRGEGLHHICIYVSDIEARLEAMKAEGCRLIDETPRVGAEGNRIAFVHPASGHGVLIELEEKAD